MKGTPKNNGAKEYGVYAAKHENLVKLVLKTLENGEGVAVGLSVEQAYAVAKVLNALADELAAELQPNFVEDAVFLEDYKKGYLGDKIRAMNEEEHNEQVIKMIEEEHGKTSEEEIKELQKRIEEKVSKG